jgi:hypothetical protein
LRKYLGLCVDDLKLKKNKKKPKMPEKFRQVNAGSD